MTIFTEQQKRIAKILTDIELSIHEREKLFRACKYVRIIAFDKDGDTGVQTVNDIIEMDKKYFLTPARYDLSMAGERFIKERFNDMHEIIMEPVPHGPDWDKLVEESQK